MAIKRKTPAQKRRARKKARQKALKAKKEKKIRKRKKKNLAKMMPKKKSFVMTTIKYSATLVITALVGIFVMQEQILNYAFQEGKSHILDFAQKAGISIDELDAQELRFAGTDAITFGSFTTLLTLPNQKQLSLSLQESKASFDFKLNIAQLKGTEFNIQVIDPEKDEDAKPLVFKGTKLRFKFLVDRKNPQGSVQEVIKQFQEILNEGKTSLNISMKGTLSMEFEGKDRDVGIKTTKKDDTTLLQMEKESFLEVIGPTAAEDLTEAEIEVLSSYPLRVARLLRIKNYSKKRAGQLAVQDNFPQDAYRHILWSWLITKEFGPEFAELVTDAHEIGAKYADDEWATNMDYNNNTLGRKYFAMGIKEVGLQAKVLSDPEVIKLSDR